MTQQFLSPVSSTSGQKEDLAGTTQPNQVNQSENGVYLFGMEWRNWSKYAQMMETDNQNKEEKQIGW